MAKKKTIEFEKRTKQKLSTSILNPTKVSATQKEYVQPKRRPVKDIFDPSKNKLIIEHGIQEIKDNKETCDYLCTIYHKKQNPYGIFLPYVQAYINEQIYDNKTHGIYQGVCPYSHNEVLYFDVLQKTLVLAKLKGTSECQKKQWDWPDAEQESLIKVFGDIITIGSVLGHIKLFSIKKEKTILTADMPEDFYSGFVRDIFLYKGKDAYYLAVLIVLNKNNSRTYTMWQFILQQEEGTDQLIILKQQSEKLYTQNNELSGTRKQEQRREFHWWETFKPVSDQYLAYQKDLHISKQQKEQIKQQVIRYNKQYLSEKKEKIYDSVVTYDTDPQVDKLSGTETICEVGIINVVKICETKQFDQPKVLLSKKPLNWIYIIEQKPTSKHFSHSGNTKVFLIINADGIEYRVVRLRDFKVKKTFFVDVPKGGFVPNDCMMLDGYRLLCSTEQGLFVFFLQVDDPKLIEYVKLNKENNCRIARSKCGRIIATSGRSKDLYLYEDSTLKTISKIENGNVCDVRMTSEHVFMKSSDKNNKGWLVVSLKETYLTKTLKGIELQAITNDIKHIIYENSKTWHDQKCLGIQCSQMIWIQKMQLAQYKSFKGHVKAVNMLAQNADDQLEIELMSQQESDDHFRVCSIILQDNTLTWFIASDIQREIYFRQTEIHTTSEIKSIPWKDQDLSFFGGFFLTVSKQNKHKAICTYADSRDSDISFTLEKWYLKINFKKEQISSITLQDQLGFPIGKEHSQGSCAFSVNDGTALIVKTKKGKEVHIGPPGNIQQIYEIKNSSEVRLSPDNDKVVVEHNTEKGREYFVAKLDGSNDNSNNGQMVQKYNLIKDSSIRGLSNLLFLSNDYFAVGQTEFLNETPKEFIVFRTSNGQPFCRFNLGEDFEFLKSNTSSNFINPHVSGIHDLKTNQVYGISLCTLIHLGATNFYLGPNDKVFHDEIQRGKVLKKYSDRNQVFGLHAPALYFKNMMDYVNLPLSKRKKRIKIELFKSTVLVTNEDKLTGEFEVRIQNAFQFLCKGNYNYSLRIWLEAKSNKTNYFNDGKSLSPIALMTRDAADVITEWFNQKMLSGNTEIFTSFGENELKTILKLPNNECRQMLTQLTPNINQKLDYEFLVADVKKEKVECISKFEDLHANKNSLQQKLFRKVRKGNPYSVFCTYLKFNFSPGSKKSKDLLATFDKIGKKNPDLFQIKVIQKILIYHDQAIGGFKIYLTSVYTMYLLLLVMLPIVNIEDAEVILAFCIYFTIIELIQFSSSGMQKRLSDYFELWNFLDIMIILLQIAYLVTHYAEWEYQNANFYGFLSLISWLNLLQYLRLFKKFRFLVDLTHQVFTDREIWNFILVMAVFCFGFTSANFFASLKHTQDDHLDDIQDEDDRAAHIQHLAFHINLGYVLMGAFGDFMPLEIFDTYEQTITFTLAVATVCLINMNLLIGILSEKLAQVLETKKRNDFKAMCDIALGLQTLMLWKIFNEEDTPAKHMIFAEATKAEEVDEWRGRIQQTVTPIENRIDKLEVKVEDDVKRLSQQIKHIANEMKKETRMVNDNIEKILQKIDKQIQQNTHSNQQHDIYKQADDLLFPHISR